MEERRKRAVERQREEYQEFLGGEEKKRACRDHFETCMRGLGLDSQASNLAETALKIRGLKLQPLTQIQVRCAEIRISLSNFCLHAGFILICLPNAGPLSRFAG